MGRLPGGVQCGERAFGARQKLQQDWVGHTDTAGRSLRPGLCSNLSSGMAFLLSQLYSLPRAGRFHCGQQQNLSACFALGAHVVFLFSLTSFICLAVKQHREMLPVIKIKT